MKMNKKGFTLIELLAVIVILAVIALIAVPQVMKILNQARESAAEDSAYGVLDATEAFVAQNLLSTHGDWNTVAEFKCEESTKKCCAVTKDNSNNETVDTTTCVDIKGTAPKEGRIVLDSEGKATIKSGANLKINGFFCLQGTDGKVDCKTSYTATSTPSGN